MCSVSRVFTPLDILGDAQEDGEGGQDEGDHVQGGLYRVWGLEARVESVDFPM